MLSDVVLSYVELCNAALSCTELYCDVLCCAYTALRYAGQCCAVLCCTALCCPLLGPFLEAPGKLTGPESEFEIKVSRKVGRVLTFDEVHFVSLADNFTVHFSNLLKLPLEWKRKRLNGPGN